MLKAIETQYKGYRFRSRLEARWAVFFDALGLKWEYEGEGFDLGEEGYYLPDFYLKDWQCYIEIKPGLPDDKAMNKAIALSRRLIREEEMEKKRVKQNMHIFCGTPGLADIEILDNDGQWKIHDGSIILNLTATAWGLPITLEAFAMTQGGKNLDIWPMYFAPIKGCGAPLFLSDSPGTLLAVLTYPSGLMPRVYFGDGVYYNSDNLLQAYTAARSARFEHGEKPG